MHIISKINVSPMEIAEWVFNDNIERAIKSYIEIVDEQLIVHVDETMRTLNDDYCLAMDSLYDIEVEVEDGSLTEDFRKEFLIDYLTLAKRYARELGYAFRIDRKKDTASVEDIINVYSKGD